MADENLNVRNNSASEPVSKPNDNVEQDADVTVPKKEIGGRDGPDPVRYGDWEKKGRCIDF